MKHKSYTNPETKGESHLSPTRYDMNSCSIVSFWSLQTCDISSVTRHGLTTYTENSSTFENNRNTINAFIVINSVDQTEWWILPCSGVPGNDMTDWGIYLPNMGRISLQMQRGLYSLNVPLLPISYENPYKQATISFQTTKSNFRKSWKWNKVHSE